MRVAVFDKFKQPLAGSDPVLVSILTPVVGISPTHVHFALPEDDSFAPEGFMAPMRTPFGQLHVAVHGQKFQWNDLIDAWAFDIKLLAAYFAMAIVLSTATAWFAVRNGLLPLRQVAHEASLIEMDTLGNRLTLSVVPTEAMPLVGAINQALERLDIGTRRQRLFTANAAHELRTPVAVLAARLDAPREPNFDSQLKRDVQRISHIIQQLLAEARAEEQSLPLDEVVDVAASVRAMVDDAALLAIRNSREIEYLGPSSAVLVQGNKSAIEAIVANLIDNALNAEPEHGAVMVRVDRNATIEVIDHGPGIAVEDRQAIFEPFWRKREDASGAGLGLAIAKELVTKLKGKIWVDDTPGGGATFKMSLPRVVE
ncbi:MAG: HAMP domain-containing histidine kinase [Alphaproteobacteria bacterium]|nr:HAMP domain-containing histidine kinase [Alphaproteobacteria bacterium]